jgi:cytochrome c oxidase assembly factor CtaG
MNMRAHIRAFSVIALCLASGLCLGHAGEDHSADAFPKMLDGRPHSWADLWRAWEFGPGAIVGVLLAGLLYLIGIRRLWKASHAGGGISRSEAGWYFAGWLALAVALISPLHLWGEVLFSAHMTQHEVLMLIAAPFMVLGRPMLAFLWAFPARPRKALAYAAATQVWSKVWFILSAPFAAWLIHALALWVWHVPVLFQAALHSNFVHALQHLSFFFSALLFWWAVIHGRHRISGYGAAILYMFTTALHSGLLGALLTFASRPWYPDYRATTWEWGLTPLEDQQIGGLIMWIPAGLAYVLAGLALFVGWLRESERRAVKWQATLDGASV